jgi:hypothetical protein
LELLPCSCREQSLAVPGASRDAGDLPYKELSVKDDDALGVITYLHTSPH